MSGLFRRNRTGIRGFTLLEMLVVLAIAGTIAAIALPGLRRLLQSLEFSGQRRAVLLQLEGLGYRAYAQGRPIQLANLPATDRSATGEPPIEMPPQWRLQAMPPIEYAFNGLCFGGKLTLVSPDSRSEVFQLKPPLCRPEPQG